MREASRSFFVNPRPEAELYVHPGYSHLTLAAGSTLTRPAFNVSNMGERLWLTWEVTSDAPWLTPTPASGALGPLGGREVAVTINAGGLSLGDHVGTLTVTTNDPLNAAIEVPFTLTVAPAPVFALTDVGFNPPPVSGNGTVEWVDFDGDGDLDLALAGADFARPNGEYAAVLRNDAGTFVDVGAELVGGWYSALGWADYDGDGDPDLAVAGNTNWTATTALYRNEGGSFVEVDAGLPAVRQGALEWGDFDADGDPDLLLTGLNDSWANVTRLYRNDAGTLVEIAGALPPPRLAPPRGLTSTPTGISTSPSGGRTEAKSPSASSATTPAPSWTRVRCSTPRRMEQPSGRMSTTMGTPTSSSRAVPRASTSGRRSTSTLRAASTLPWWEPTGSGVPASRSATTTPMAMSTRPLLVARATGSTSTRTAVPQRTRHPARRAR